MEFRNIGQSKDTSRENGIELPAPIKRLAEESLRTERPYIAPASLLRPVGDTNFFVTEASNINEVVPIGAIMFEGKEYVVGTIRVPLGGEGANRIH